MTRYSIKLDIEEIKSIAKKFGVKFYFYSGDYKKNLMYKAPLDLSDREGINKNFALCRRGNECIFLCKGNLYRYYQGISPQEILSKLAVPVPECRYCNKSANDPNSCHLLTAAELQCRVLQISELLHRLLISRLGISAPSRSKLQFPAHE